MVFFAFLKEVQVNHVTQSTSFWGGIARHYYLLAITVETGKVLMRVNVQAECWFFLLENQVASFELCSFVIG